MSTVPLPKTYLGHVYRGQKFTVKFTRMQYPCSAHENLELVAKLLNHKGKPKKVSVFVFNVDNPYYALLWYDTVEKQFMLQRKGHHTPRFGRPPVEFNPVRVWANGSFSDSVNPQWRFHLRNFKDNKRMYEGVPKET